MSEVTDHQASSQRVTEWWATEGRDANHWIAVPDVIRNVNARATDDADTDWVTHSSRFLARLPTPRKALSLGCGFGVLERRLRDEDVCQLIDGVDLAEPAVERARQLAVEQGYDGLSYWTADLNTVELPAGAYDAVYAHASLDHVFHLEHLLDQVRSALKPSGVFVAYEYVGPTQMQFPKADLELADTLLRAIPVQHRRLLDGTVKAAAPRISLEDMNASDPSEAIRSQEIVSLVASRFRVDHLRYIGGTLLLLVLNDIAHNFVDGDGDTDALLDALIAVENVLVDGGVLPSYHAYLVCGKAEHPLVAQTHDLPPAPRRSSLRPRTVASGGTRA